MNRGVAETRPLSFHKQDECTSLAATSPQALERSHGQTTHGGTSDSSGEARRRWPHRSCTKEGATSAQAGRRSLVALPAPPRCDAVQRVPLQFMVITEQIHSHLIPLGLTVPGDHDALGPEGRQVFLFDALPTPRTPHAIHPHEVPDRPRPGFPPHTRLHAQPCAAHSAGPSAQHASLTPNRHRASSQWASGTLDASPPPGASVTNRNVRAGEQPNHKSRVRPRQPEVSFSQMHCTSYTPSASRFR